MRKVTLLESVADGRESRLGAVVQLIVQRRLHDRLEHSLSHLLTLKIAIERSALNKADVAVSPIGDPEPRQADTAAHRSAEREANLATGADNFVLRLLIGCARQSAYEHCLGAIFIRKIRELSVEPAL